MVNPDHPPRRILRPKHYPKWLKEREERYEKWKHQQQKETKKGR